ncbi:MAG: Nif3-like dinuclear metal center hexameric protein, partial [Armatimonadetes bacterium]|nr:Nif3-like dinuclear metal center hexameric protein [Armatimonadota bacterium]
EIARVGVTWMSTFAKVRDAITRKLDLLITHEPTFWVHARELEHIESWGPDSPKHQAAQRKRKFIEDAGLVVLRVHDAWDSMPEIGVPWAWAKHLELEGPPVATGPHDFQQRYDIQPVALDDLAARVASRTAQFGESAVQVVGEGDRMVSKVGIGTGCYCDLELFQQLGCDVSIICDDSNWYWEGIAFAADSDHAVIRVNHGVSEEPGMITLTEYINSNLPVTAEHLPHGSTFHLVS